MKPNLDFRVVRKQTSLIPTTQSIVHCYHLDVKFSNFSMYVYTGMGAAHVCEDQRTTCMSEFSPSTMYVLGINSSV